MSPVVSPSLDRHKEEGSLHATHEQEFDSNRRRTGTACNGWRNVMSQDDVDSQTLSILVYLFPRMS